MPMAESQIEDYLLIASGTSHYAPFLAGWQEFKDHLRRIVAYQPGWVDVIQGARKGEMQGWARLDRKKDADSAYAQYSRSKGILIHLFKTSRGTGEYRLMKCNCSPYFPGVSERSHSAHRSGVDDGGVNQYINKVNAVAAPQYMAPPAPTYSYAVYPQPVSYMATPTYPAYAMHQGPTQLAVPHMPMYSANTSGIPVNVRDGAIFTEARGIFINNLSYSVGPNDLQALISKGATPVYCKLHRDPRTGQFKGSATAKFSTKEEAMNAVAQLNRTQHMGMTINVRLDTDTTVVGRMQAPAIVNGSNVF